MSDVTAPARPFAVGDRVEICRNLDHPAWMDLLNADDRHGGSRWVRRQGLEERLGESVISKAGVQRGRACVWLDATRFWYLQGTGMQEGSEATYLAHVELPNAADYDHLDDETVDRAWHDDRVTTHIAVYGRGLYERADFPWSHDGNLDHAMYAFPAGEPAGRVPCFDCDCTGWAGGPGVIDERCNTCKGTGRVWVGL